MNKNNVDPELVLKAISEVRDPDKEFSDYKFIDEVEKTHSAPKNKGNDGLSNWLAELAIYKEKGDLVVDKQLVNKLDAILADEEGVEDRSRFSNIVYDSEGRPGSKESLLDNEVDGHQRLINKVQEFYKETNGPDLDQLYKDEGSLLECSNEFRNDVLNIVDDLGNQPTKSEQIDQGGEIEMARNTDDPDDLGRQAADARLSQQEMYDNLSDLGTAIFDTLVEEYEIALDTAYDAVRTAEHKAGDALTNSEEDYEAVAEFTEGLTEQVLEESESIDIDRLADRAYDRFDTEMGTMERNRERFKDENSEYF